MKKGTAIAIFIIYLASIVLIGFFGIRVRVYNKVTYIESVSVRPEAETGVAKLSENPIAEEDGTFYPIYELKVYYSKHAKTGEFKDADGNKVTRRFVSLSLISTFIFTDGTKEEVSSDKITLTFRNSAPVENGHVSLVDGTSLILFKPGITFSICIKPTSSGNVRALSTAGVVLRVTVG